MLSLLRPRPLDLLSTVACFSLAVAGLGCQQSQVHSAAPATERADAAAPVATPGEDVDAAAPPAPDAFSLPSDVPVAEAAPPAGPATVVYAQSGSDLFKVDPDTLAITRVGNLVEMTADGKMRFLNDVTDIAVDRQGHIVGVHAGELLEIDSQTAICKPIATLPATSNYNGLSWIRTDSGSEILVATAIDGSVVRIDPTSGAVTAIGSLGAGLASSGDVVSVASYGTLVTVIGPQSDLLAKLDPATGAATVIGPTGFKHIWGLGFWGNRVFGFTDAGEFILLDPKTGMGTLVQKDSAYPFWGAGVTTSAVVKID